MTYDANSQTYIMCLVTSVIKIITKHIAVMYVCFGVHHLLHELYKDEMLHMCILDSSTICYM